MSLFKLQLLINKICNIFLKLKLKIYDIFSVQSSIFRIAKYEKGES